MQRDVYWLRIICVSAAIVAMFAVVSHDLYQLQIGRHEELYGKARARYTASRTERGSRGHIFDINGNLLAGNLACRDILAEPRRFRQTPQAIAQAMHVELGVDRDLLLQRFQQAIAQNRIEVVVASHVALGQAQRLEQMRISGLRYVDSYRRYYPKYSLLSNLLGFTDSELRGATGLEAHLEPLLQPTVGKQLYIRDRKGRQLANPAQQLEQPYDGADIWLTIDEAVQHIVEEELANLVATHAPLAAYALMADPATGAIMAWAQWPSFDPNDRSQMQPENWRNRILSDGFEPGSTMKCVAIAGALDYGIVDLDSEFYCEKGLWYFAGRPLRDSGHRYEDLSVREIVKRSSNIGTAKIAIAMGPQRLHQTFVRFGFGAVTGLGLAHEARGIYRAPAQWDSLSISRFPIGHGILTTPLQLVQAYCALANDGKMMQLHVVDRYRDSVSGEIHLTQPQFKRRAVRPEAARQMVEAMKLVTETGGTATRAAVPGFAVAGKTGTAQKVIDGQYSHSKHIASFIGFVPADNPAFVLLVVADEPSKGSSYGGTVTGPTFSRIATKTLAYLQIAPRSRQLLSSGSNAASAAAVMPAGSTTTTMATLP